MIQHRKGQPQPRRKDGHVKTDISYLSRIALLMLSYHPYRYMVRYLETVPKLVKNLVHQLQE